MKTITINEIKLEVPDSEVEKLVKKYSKKETVEDYLKVTGQIYAIHNADIVSCGIAANDSLLMGESTSREQLESILELNKLANVARKLNDGWNPNISVNDRRFSVFINSNGNVFSSEVIISHCSLIYFKSIELAQKAIDLLGKESIKKALTLNYK